jgi:hypothetical protein
LVRGWQCFFLLFWAYWILALFMLRIN